MNIIPAIDIRNGKCVRLFQGQFDKEKVYADDPVAQALKWKREGAKMLHIVDLDGAKTGKMKNIKIIKKIVQSVKIPIQVGGGVCDEVIIDQLIAIGVPGIILGSAAILNQNFLMNMINIYKEKIIVSVDGKNGNIVINGWQTETNTKIVQLLRKLENLGIQRCIYTDISVDGTLTAPNYKEIQKVLRSASFPITIAGGVSSIEDLKKLEQLGIENVIVGKALYEGRIKLC